MTDISPQQRLNAGKKKAVDSLKQGLSRSGTSFLIEYDNTQNNANHIHSVWRDFSGDFGLDVLAKHYRDAHH